MGLAARRWADPSPHPSLWLNESPTGGREALQRLESAARVGQHAASVGLIW